MKTCSKCKRELSLNEFYINRASKDGYTAFCKVCTSVDNKNWHKKNKDRNSVRCAAWRNENKERNKANGAAWDAKNRNKIKGYNLKRNYGITEADYQSMLEKQHGTCAICTKTCSTGRRLCVDHCHTTGEVRGLLCKRCNTAIALLGDSVEGVSKAASYLLYTQSALH